MTTRNKSIRRRGTPLQQWRAEYASIVRLIWANRLITRGRKPHLSTLRLIAQGHSEAQIARIVRKAQKPVSMAQSAGAELSRMARIHMGRREEAAEATRLLWIADNADRTTGDDLKVAAYEGQV